MLSSFPVAFVIGTALGFLSGLGVGGGSLLILWLTFVLHMAPSSARCINLLFFLPSAIVSSVLRFKSDQLKIKPLLPAILSGCIAAVLFSWLSTTLDVTMLRKLFGGILILTGLREVFYTKNSRDES